LSGHFEKFEEEPGSWEFLLMNEVPIGFSLVFLAEEINFRKLFFLDFFLEMLTFCKENHPWMLGHFNVRDIHLIFGQNDL